MKIIDYDSQNRPIWKDDDYVEKKKEVAEKEEPKATEVKKPKPKNKPKKK